MFAPVSSQQTSASTLTKHTDEMNAEAFQCCVCCDLLVDPVVFPCGHDSCFACFNSWILNCLERGVTPACPLCRAQLPPSLGVCHRLRKTVESLHPEVSSQRKNEICACAGAVDPVNLGGFANFLATACPVSWFGVANTSSFMGNILQVQILQTDMAPPGVLPPRMSGRSESALDENGDSISGDDQLGTANPPRAAPALWGMQQTSTVQEGAVDADATVFVRGRCSSAGSGRWQSALDSRIRLQVARSILQILKAKGGPGINGDRLLAMVRQLELNLYRRGETREAYMDQSTLAPRMLAVIRQFRSKRGAVC